MKDTLHVLVLVIACLLLGCASSAKNKTQFYRLGAVQELSSRQAEAVGQGAENLIAIRKVTIPDYLRRPQIVYQVGEYRFVRDDLTQWAEPLQTGIRRVLLENLSRLRSNVEWRAVKGRTDTNSVLVDVELIEFHSTDSNICILKALLNIDRSNTKGEAHLIEIEQAVENDSTDARIRSYSRLIQQLADKINRIVG